MTRTVRLALAAIVAGLLSLPAAALADTPPDGCAVITSTLTDRPENGHHGQWATDTLTRTVTICPAAEGDLAWHATVADEGTFTTIDSLSPQAGVALPAGVTGAVHGSFSADFTTSAPLDLGSLAEPPHDTSTSLWVQTIVGAWWASGSSINGDWTWTYTTACEQWVDAAANNDGAGADAGDITGADCPTPTTPTSSSTSTSTTAPPPSSSTTSSTSEPTTSSTPAPPTTSGPAITLAAGPGPCELDATLVGLRPAAARLEFTDTRGHHFDFPLSAADIAASGTVGVGPVAAGTWRASVGNLRSGAVTLHGGCSPNGSPAITSPPTLGSSSGETALPFTGGPDPWPLLTTALAILVAGGVALWHTRTRRPGSGA